MWAAATNRNAMGLDALDQYNLSRFLGSFLFGMTSNSVLQLSRSTLM